MTSLYFLVGIKNWAKIIDRHTDLKGKMHFGIVLPFRQYFWLILQVLQNLCLQLNFRLHQNFRKTEFWYNTELSSTITPFFGYHYRRKFCSSPFFRCRLLFMKPFHTTYSWNIKLQKCAGISGLRVLNEIIQKIYPENMKKIVGAVWKLPAK